MAEFDFRSPELSDREWIEPLLLQSGFRGCLYTFGNNYVWKDVYNVKICRYRDFYLLQNRDNSVFRDSCIRLEAAISAHL